MIKANRVVTGLVATLLAACVVSCSTKQATTGSITSAPFGQTPDGKAVTLFTLQNTNGVVATICNHGGIVTSLQVPDRTGAMGDVVLGYDNLAARLRDCIAAFTSSALCWYSSLVLRGT